MEALKAELERKRKAKGSLFAGKKFARLEEVNARTLPTPEPAADVRAAQAPQAQAVSAQEVTAPPAAALPPPVEEPAEANVAAGATVLPADVEALDVAEAVRRLRLLGQPATLFGECARDRLLRLHVVQRNLQPLQETGGGQQANEKGRAMRELARQAAVGRLGGGGAAPPRELSEEEATAAAFKAAAAALALQRAESSLEHGERIVLHFKRLVEEWEAEVGARCESQPAWAGSLEGRNAISTMKLTKDHIRPLFRLLKRKECPSDIERALWCIVRAMRVRNYKEAGDLYVRVAIGNAPWPIGVTMVGIHERSAREKISANGTAHVLHDEQTRKYLQSVKRLITFAQRKYPSTPSLSLEFNSGVNGSDKQALLAATASAGNAAAAQPLLMLEALPGTYAMAPDGSKQDGWRANDQDIRTWKSIMRRAYTDDEKQ